MKVICEIYRDTDNKDLGEIGRRAKHSLDFVDALQYLNLPDEFLTLADEYMVSQNVNVGNVRKIIRIRPVYF